jgi:hypothetical protein
MFVPDSSILQAIIIPLGNLIGLTDANVHTMQKLFNVLNQQAQKTLPDLTLTETRTYDAAGNLQTLTHFS